MLTALLLIELLNTVVLAFIVWRHYAMSGEAAALWAYLVERDNAIHELTNRLLAKNGYRPIGRAEARTGEQESGRAAEFDESASANDSPPSTPKSRSVSILAQKRLAAKLEAQ
jgi:hypothetical protein